MCYKVNPKMKTCSGSFDGSRANFDVHLPGRERVSVLLQLLQDRQVRMDLSEGQVKLIKWITLVVCRLDKKVKKAFCLSYVGRAELT